LYRKASFLSSGVSSPFSSVLTVDQHLLILDEPALILTLIDNDLSIILFLAGAL